MSSFKNYIFFSCHAVSNYRSKIYGSCMELVWISLLYWYWWDKVNIKKKYFWENKKWARGTFVRVTRMFLRVSNPMYDFIICKFYYCHVWLYVCGVKTVKWNERIEGFVLNRIRQLNPHKFTVVGYAEDTGRIMLLYPREPILWKRNIMPRESTDDENVMVQSRCKTHTKPTVRGMRDDDKNVVGFVSAFNR